MNQLKTDEPEPRKAVDVLGRAFQIINHEECWIAKIDLQLRGIADKMDASLKEKPNREMVARDEYFFVGGEGRMRGDEELHAPEPKCFGRGSFGHSAWSGILMPPVLRQMLHVASQGYPRVLIRLPDGARGSWKARVGEGTDGDDDVCIPLPLVVNDGAAMRAEVEGGPAAFLVQADIGGGSATNLDGIPWEAGLGGQGAAGAPLAIQAVADGDAQRRRRDGGGELAAATGGEARGHGQEDERGEVRNT